MRYILVSLTDLNQEVKPGDLVTNTRNEQWVYDDFTPPSAEGHDAKVLVHTQQNPEQKREFFARIFGLVVKGIPTAEDSLDKEIEKALDRHDKAEE